MWAICSGMAQAFSKTFFRTPVRAALMSFLLTAIVFSIFRSGLYPVFSTDWYALRYAPMFGEANFFTIFNHQYHTADFRPLDKLVWASIGKAYKEFGLDFYRIWVPVYSLLLGSLSALIFGITYIFSRKILIGLLAAFIYTFSIANISATWHSIAFAFFIGPYILTCLGIFSYLRYRAVGLPQLWLTLFIVSCLLAPWFREIGFIPAAVVFGVELVRLIHKRSIFIFLPSVLLLHGFFPKVIPKVFGFYDGPIKILGSEGAFAKNLSGTIYNFMDAPHVVSNISPLIWIAAMVGISLSIPTLYPALSHWSYWKRWSKTLGTFDLFKENTSPAGLGLSPFVSVIFFLVLFALLYLDMTGYKVEGLQNYHAAFLGLLVIVTAVRFGPLFSAWFVAAFLTLIVYSGNQQLQNGVVLIPLAIIISLFIGEVMSSIKKRALGLGFQKCAFFALIGALGFGLANQFSNVFVNYYNIKNMTEGHKRVAHYLENNLPMGATIFWGFYPGADIACLTGNGRLLPIHYPKILNWMMAFPQLPFYQLRQIRKAKEKKSSVFYLTLSSKSQEQILLPLRRLNHLKTIKFKIFHFNLDPLFYLLDNKRHTRNVTPGEWQFAYSWIGWGKNCCEWTVSIEILELPMTKMDGLEINDFKFFNTN